MAAIDERNLVADALHALHIVGGEYHSGSRITQMKNLIFKQFGIDRVESGEGFVENQELRVVEHGDDKLHLLRHTLR